MQITYENYCTLKMEVFKINICSNQVKPSAKVSLLRQMPQFFDNLQISQDYDYSFDKEGPCKSNIFGYISEDT